MQACLLSLLVGSLVVAGCGVRENRLPTNPSPVVAAVGVAVASIGDRTGLARTWQFQATATAHFSDGSTLDVTREVAWASTNEAVAVVAVDGQIQARGPGWTEIRATYRGVLGRVTFGIEVGVGDGLVH